MKMLRSESGQTLVLVAAFMGLVAFGFLAFAVDVGSLFRQKRMAQSAADAAALAAAEEVATGNSSNKQAIANAMAKLNGFDTTLSSNPASVTLQQPLSGNFAGPSYVQATVSRPIPTIFLRAFSGTMATMPVSATAIAGGAKSSQTCVCLEGTSGQALNLTSGAQLSAAACGIVDNSSSSNALGVTSGATLNALTLGTVSSSWNNASNINSGGSITSGTTIVQGITSKCTPTLPTAPVYSTCLPNPGGTFGTYAWGPPTASGVICYNGLTVGSPGAVVTLRPGTYVIPTGTLHFEAGMNGHSNLGGNGIFFYLTGNANFVSDAGANVNLVAGGAQKADGTTAPSVGAYDGIVVYQARSDTNALSFQAGSTTYINGALYAPSAAITIGSGSTVTGGIDASSLTVNSGAILNAIADTNEGSLIMGSAKLVQ